MDITVYWKNGDIERATTPYPDDLTVDKWRVGIRQDKRNKKSWGVVFWYTGSSQGTSRATYGTIAEDPDARSREGYEAWLEDHVTLITVDGYPFWSSEEATEDDEEE